MVSEDILKLASYVTISSYRRKVMDNLDEGQVKIPTTLAKESDIRTNHISKVLRELKDHDLVECINEEVRKGRLYRLTPLGVEVKTHFDDEGGIINETSGLFS